jgi:hypothetical protein
MGTKPFREVGENIRSLAHMTILYYLDLGAFSVVSHLKKIPDCRIF